MKKIICLALPVFLLFTLGCMPLIIGGAVGALGGYAVSRDTIQGETDTPYESLWNAALTVGKIRGTIKQEDYNSGAINLEVGQSRVWVRLIRLTDATTRVKISARKYHLPDISLAQELFVKIIEQAK